MYYNNPTLISIIEVLLILVPALLAVAYVTVAERKTMASMQRRLGPNVVGYYGLLQALNKNITIRRYHTTSKLNNNDSVEHDFVGSPLLNNDITKELYNNRIAPVKAFSDKVLLSCHNILDLEKRAEFFKNLKEIPNYDKGGIYLFQYNKDPLVYYIGRTSTFSARFKSHIKHKTTDKFHVFANLVG
jgi:hypothetical protein